MTCGDCLARLGAEPEQNDLEVARHLRHCAACRAEWELLQSALLVLESEPLPSAPDLVPGLHRALAAERRQAQALRPLQRRERWLAVGFGLAALTGLGLYCRWHWPDWQAPSLWATAQAWIAQLPRPLLPAPRSLLDAVPALPGQLLAQLDEAWRQARQAATLLTPPTLPVSALWLVLLAAFAAAVNEALTRRYGRLVAPGERS